MADSPRSGVESNLFTFRENLAKLLTNQESLMTIVSVHAAKTNLSRLIAQACSGEEIIIARGSEPVVKLVPIRAVPQKREPGTLRGQFTVPPSFFEPLPEDEIDSWNQ